MAQVTCPRCQTRQPLDDAAGYTCTSCGTLWSLTACENCSVRFHMRPGTTDWTCPDCGHENGSATMGEFEPETEIQPEPTVPPSEPLAAPSHAAPSPARRSRRPPTRARLATIAIVGIVAVLLVAVGLSSLGDGSTESASPTPSLTTTEQLCLQLRDLQTPREDAMTRLGDTLRADAVTFKSEGAAQLAADVLALRKAVLAYRDVLVVHGDLGIVSTELGKALTALPCG